jgi:hypothetical protein
MKAIVCLLLSLLVFAPVTTLADVDLVNETTFYKFDEAWLEISGEAKDSVYNVATLYVKHIQQNSKVERLLYIPVSVSFSSPASVPFHFTNTWTVPMGNLQGQKLSDVFAARGSDMIITAGFISEGEIDEIYVIYSDRKSVAIVDLKSILDLPL